MPHQPERRVTGKPRARSAYIRCATLAGVVLALICAVVLYWLLFPAQMFDASSPPTIDGQQYEPGGPVTFTYESLCVDQQRDLTVQRLVVNNDTGLTLHLLPYSYEAGDIETGCRSGVVEVTPLPPEVVAGSYHLQIDLTYQANPVRTVTETYDTPNFTIVPKRDGNGAQLP